MAITDKKVMVRLSKSGEAKKTQPAAEIDEHEAEIREKFEKKYAEKEKALISRHEQLLDDIEEKKKELARREDKIREAEIEMKKGFTESRSKFASELASELSAGKEKINREIGDYRTKRFAELDEFFKAESTSRNAAIENEIKAKWAKFESEKNAEEQRLENLKVELINERKNIEVERDNAVFNKDKYEQKLKDLERQKKDLKDREAGLEEKVRMEMEPKVARLERDRNEYLEKLRSFQNMEIKENEIKKLKDELERVYGDPKEYDRKMREKKEKDEEQLEEKRREMKKELDSKDEAIKELRKDNKRLEEQKKALEYLEQDNQNLNRLLEKKYKEAVDLEKEKDKEIAALKKEKADLKNEKDTLDIDRGGLQENFNKLNLVLKKYEEFYKDADGVEKRKTTIETPPPGFDMPRKREDKEISEMEWLSKILDSCKEHGYIFPSRLLYAFHTALKIADWSCITVLAGVSGTGKSKLPELYSHFGGINFFNLPVQPNWDSKESMLGFFNSIERKFDAQEVLQFLAQTQRKEEDNFGLKDTLSIILLDEMNLANVELYFAEFLSKLEERSGKEDGEEPTINIKLGSDQSDYYPLKLGRNVLWVGTMNQDETTKSLSDKVLDRGIVISFPHPPSLKHDEKKALPDRTPLLPFEIWKDWKRSNTNTSFVPDWIEQCRGFVEEVSKNMHQVGLGIGYRMWQSIEQYMINHPRVLSAYAKIEQAAENNDEQSKNSAIKEQKSALKDAFEDQLAQKVMPKLRGIETSGEQEKKCLRPIRDLLINDKDNNYPELVKDFDNAMKFGNGQFVWNSSNYLNKY